MMIFTLIGMWILLIIGIFAIPIFFALCDRTFEPIESYGMTLTIIVIIFTLGLCSFYLYFIGNPEKFGYTKIQIEQELVD